MKIARFGRPWDSRYFLMPSSALCFLSAFMIFRFR